MATASVKLQSIVHHGRSYCPCIITCPSFRNSPALKPKKFVGKAGRPMCSAAIVETDVRKQEYCWTEVDQFTDLNDRLDSSPIPLPPIKEAKRVILVRHGQSTWNAEGRIQGSSDISVLTKKGESQAETTQQMVRCAELQGASPQSDMALQNFWLTFPAV